MLFRSVTLSELFCYSVAMARHLRVADRTYKLHFEEGLGTAKSDNGDSVKSVRAFFEAQR